MTNKGKGKGKKTKKQDIVSTRQQETINYNDIPKQSNRFQLFAESDFDDEISIGNVNSQSSDNNIINDSPQQDDDVQSDLGVYGMFEKLMLSFSELDTKFDRFNDRLNIIEDQFVSVNMAITDLTNKYNQLYDNTNKNNIALNKLHDKYEKIGNEINNMKPTKIADMEFPVSTSLVFSGVQEASEHSSLDSLIGGVIRFGTRTADVKIIKTKRMKSFNNNPGKVLVQVGSVEEKVSVLRNKRNLKDNSPFFRKVFVKSAQTKEERLIEQNTRALLRYIPGLPSLRLSASGMIVHNETSHQHGGTYETGNHSTTHSNNAVSVNRIHSNDMKEVNNTQHHQHTSSQDHRYNCDTMQNNNTHQLNFSSTHASLANKPTRFNRLERNMDYMNSRPSTSTR